MYAFYGGLCGNEYEMLYGFFEEITNTGGEQWEKTVLYGFYVFARWELLLWVRKIQKIGQQRQNEKIGRSPTLIILRFLRACKGKLYALHTIPLFAV